MPSRRNSPIRGLAKAANNNDLETARKELARSPDLLRGHNGWEPLIYAARKGFFEMATLLLDHGADPNASPSYGKTSAHTDLERPLHWACDFGRPDIVQLLLDRGAEVEGCQTWKTPLLQAARTGRPNVCEILETASGKRHFLVQVVSSSVEDVNRSLLDDPSLVRVADEYGTTAVHLAGEQWRPDVVELLLDSGGDATARDAHRETPLHLLAIHPQDGVLWWGDKRNTDFDDLFSQDDQIAVAELLVEHGADVRTQNWRKLTPLHRAVRAGRVRYVEFLLDQGADVNAADVAGDTPLRRAVTMKDRMDVARTLIEWGANVNAVNKRGKSVLDCARSRVMKSLIEDALG